MERKLPSSCCPTSSVATRVLAGGAAIAVGCYFAQRVTVPAYVLPVEDFEVERYLGHWYEIARIDYFFERGLTSCTADYDLNADGSMTVFNQGFDPKKGAWKSAKAVAKFIGAPSNGSLKVSFFRPIYSGYHIVHVDAEYQYAVVVGDRSKYCWVLSRSPDMDEKLYAGLLSVAAANGVDISRMHKVPHGALLEEDNE
jgi:apolipoprotein D and lipocalin family protein